MKFYRVSTTYENLRHQGYSFFTTRREAEADLKAGRASAIENDDRLELTGGEIEEINIEPTKQGILKALNRYASHSDNG